jgi:hypothetical protein
MSATVTYKSLIGKEYTLDPPPFVAQSREAVDAGLMRLGYVENYELDGIYSGHFTDAYTGAYQIWSTGTGLGQNSYTGLDKTSKEPHPEYFSNFDNFTGLSNIFSQSPGVLKIVSNSVTILEKTGFVMSFSTPKNNFSSRMASKYDATLLPYNVKFKAFDVSSGIKDPSFEYNFNENEDRSVNLSVKASAVGIVSIFDSQNFVEGLLSEFNLTGFQPLYINTGGNWSLLSNKKTIDRSKFSYSVERNYRCNPSGYINEDFLFSETTKVSEQNSPYGAEYRSFQFETNLKILADDSKNYQKQKSWKDVEDKFSQKNYIEEISKHYIKRYGSSNVDDFILNSVSISKNSGANEVSFKWELLSGKAADFSGYFDYSVSTTEDLSSQERSISLDGQYLIKGDLTNRKESLEKWLKGNFTPEGFNQKMPQKNSRADYFEFVKGLTGIGTGAISGGFNIDSLDVDYNSGLADFKISCRADNKPRILPGSDFNFSVDIQESTPIYKFIPATNIEGHYIIQDLQCKTAEKASIKVEGNADSALNLINFFGTGVYFVSEIYDKFINQPVKLKNYETIVPENLNISSGLSDATFNIDYSLMYSGNKTNNHASYLGIAPPKAPNASSSIRTKHYFGR